jgi:sulfur carrier protein
MTAAATISSTVEAPVIFVNDKPRPLGASASVTALLSELGLTERKGVAVAVNGTVVPRTEWSTRTLAAADRVLVIQATQGG